MKFFQRVTIEKVLEKLGFDKSIDENLVGIFKMCLDAGQTESASKRMVAQYRLDAEWAAKNKPYFNIWPKIQSAFTQTSLEITGEHIHLPIQPILIRFSEEEPLFVMEDVAIRSILATEVEVNEFGGFEHQRGLSVFIDIGEKYCDGEFTSSVYTYVIFPLRKNEVVEETLKKIEGDHYNETETMTTHKRMSQGELAEDERLTIDSAVRVVLSLCMLGMDSNLLSPDVLSKDLAKYKRTLDASLVAKAHRRGKIGWHVGRDIEVSPHFRRPHFGIRWTGKGRAIPKLVPIKGSVINRSKVETVPTGYLGELGGSDD
jgi:hypothetical protein